MKKYLALFIFLLFITLLFSACRGARTPGETPTPSDEDAVIQSLGEIPAPSDDNAVAQPLGETPAPEDGAANYDDDPIIEYMPGENAVELAQNPENLVLTNSFLEMSFTIPRGWYVWFIDEHNLRADPELTADEKDFITSEDEETGEEYADLFDIGNTGDQYDNAHLGIAARATKLNGMMFEDYLDGFKEKTLASDNANLVYEGVTDVNGEAFGRLVFFIHNPYNEYDSRMLDTFAIERNGCAVVIRFECWAAYPDNEKEMMSFMHYYVSAGAAATK